jgi:RNA polymerase sigma factor (TIGR02999 family)
MRESTWRTIIGTPDIRRIIGLSSSGLSDSEGGPLRQSPQEISALLRAWGGGDELALNKLMLIVQDELHQLAHAYMKRERAGHTLQTTALVNEAYMRLIDANLVEWQDRAHFFGIAAKLMRRVLVDYARSRGYQKRGGNVRRMALDEALVVAPEPDQDLVRLDDALNALSEFDSRKARVVELRYFGGLSVEETAEVLKVAPITVIRDWNMARLWLLKELKRE